MPQITFHAPNDFQIRLIAPSIPSPAIHGSSQPVTHVTKPDGVQVLGGCCRLMAQTLRHRSNFAPFVVIQNGRCQVPDGVEVELLRDGVLVKSGHPSHKHFLFAKGNRKMHIPPIPVRIAIPKSYNIGHLRWPAIFQQNLLS